MINLSFNNDATIKPEWLILLQGVIFNGLRKDDREDFHAELEKRIPAGVDLGPVKHMIAISRMDRLLQTQRRALEQKHPHGVHEAIAQVVSVLEFTKLAHDIALKGEARLLKESACSARSARAAWSEDAWSAAAWSAAWSAEVWDVAEAESAAAAISSGLAWEAERDALFTALDRVGGE